MGTPVLRGVKHQTITTAGQVPAPAGTAAGDLQVMILYCSSGTLSGTTGWQALGTYPGRFTYGFIVWTRNVPAGEEALPTNVAVDTNGTAWLIGYAPGGCGVVATNVGYWDHGNPGMAMPQAGTAVMIGVERTSTVNDTTDLSISGVTLTTRFNYPGDGLDVGRVADGAISQGTHNPGMSYNNNTDGYLSLVLGMANIAPLAPTITAPSTGAAVPDSPPPTVDWQFNDPGDTQSSADVQFKPAGGPTWTTRTGIATTATSYQFNVGDLTDGQQYEVQVRTTDSSGLVGPWSASTLFTPYAVPAAPTITAPAAGATITDQSSAPLDWTPITGQGSYQAQRVGLDGTIYEDTGQVTGAASQVTFTGTGHPSGGGQERWQVRVWANGNPLASAYSSVTITIQLDPPAVPLLTATALIDQAAVAWSITNPDPGTGQVATAWTELVRTGPDGVTRQVATNLPANATGIDYQPPTGSSDYRAIAHAASGTTAESA